MHTSFMKLPVIIFALTIVSGTHAQHVGIETLNPTQTLSVNGTVVVDHDTTNFGSPQQAGLWFGAHGRTVLNSNNNTFDSKYGSLNFWTSGQHRLAISAGGNIGIGVQDPLYKLQVAGTIHSSNSITASSNITANNKIYADNGVFTGGGIYNNSYKLQVNNGNSYFGGAGTFTGNVTVNGILTSGSHTVNGNMTVTGLIRAWSNSIQADDRMAIGGAIDQNYRLRVWDGNARIGGDLHATGRAAIGGDIDEEWRFRVYNGDSRFGGNVQVTGDLEANALTINQINGNGVVRSNGGSSLRIGFDQAHVTVLLAAGGTHDETVSITAFEGGATNVRVFLSQIMPDPDDLDWSQFNIKVFDVDSATDTCKLRITNISGSTREFDSWIYLTSIAKD